jgi:hypothetical protein
MQPVALRLGFGCPLNQRFLSLVPADFLGWMIRMGATGWSGLTKSQLILAKFEEKNCK